MCKTKGVLSTLCQIIQNYVKSNCNMLKSSVRLVDYSYVELVKSIVDMTNSNASLGCKSGATNYRDRIRSQGDVY